MIGMERTASTVRRGTNLVADMNSVAGVESKEGNRFANSVEMPKTEIGLEAVAVDVAAVVAGNLSNFDSLSTAVAEIIPR